MSCCNKKEKPTTTFKEIDNALGKYYQHYGLNDHFYPSNEEHSIFLKYVYHNDLNENELEQQLNEDADWRQCKYLQFDVNNFPCYDYNNIAKTQQNKIEPKQPETPVKEEEHYIEMQSAMIMDITTHEIQSVTTKKKKRKKKHSIALPEILPAYIRYELIFEVLQHCYLYKNPPSRTKRGFNRFKYIALMSWEIIGPFGYYAGLYANYQVIRDYISSLAYGYAVITCIALFGGLMAQSFWANSALLIYKNRHSFWLSFLISMFFGTPFYIWLTLLFLQCQKNIYNKHKYEQFIDNSWLRYNLVINFFQSPVLECIQIYIVGQYLLYSEETRKIHGITYPNTNIEFYFLLYACYGSFRGLSDAAWSRIEPMVKSVDGEVGGRSRTQRVILFRVRAFIETLLRALRFMMVSSIYGGLIGFIILLIEVIWKFALASCCCYITKQIPVKYTFGQKIYAAATWLIFSHERFGLKLAYLMRITDIFLWTLFCVGLSIIGVYFHYELPLFIKDTILGKILYKIEINGICYKFGDFRNDCYPIEILIIIFVLLIILIIIYRLSPSIFLLGQKTVEQRQRKQNEIMTEMVPIKKEINVENTTSQRKQIETVTTATVPQIQQQQLQQSQQDNHFIQYQMPMIMNNTPIAFIQNDTEMVPIVKKDNKCEENSIKSNDSKEKEENDELKEKSQQNSVPLAGPPIIGHHDVNADPFQSHYIQQQSQMIMPKQHYIQSQQMMIQPQQHYIQSQQMMIQPQQHYIQSQMAMIHYIQQHYIQSQQMMIQPQQHYIQSQQ
eukprot:540076_1